MDPAVLVIAVPEGATSHHLAPKSLLPWPVSEPWFVSEPVVPFT